MFYMKRLLFLVIVLGLAAVPLRASHIRAGEITLQKTNPLNNLQYEITIWVYYDNTSGVNNDSADLDIYTGTNPAPTTVRIPQVSNTNIGNNTRLGIFKTVYVFPSSGVFTLIYTEIFRNGGIINMSNPAGTNFSLQTRFTIDAILGNTTPVLTVPPIDVAYTNEVWLHNPGAYDADGDSLSFRLVIPRSDFGVNVLGYVYPNSTSIPGNTSSDIFVQDPVSGLITWNVPRRGGVEYNVAFLVEEWRRGVILSSTLRDMQITVLQGINNPPILRSLIDTCVIAGDTITKLISAVDPDGDSINLTAFGGPFLLGNSPATFSVTNPVLNNEPGLFEWKTICSHVRAQPYQVVFRATDIKPQNRNLSDIKGWNITVLGPPPNLLSAIPAGKTVQLNWAPYACSNAIRMAIWRKEGPPGLNLGTCPQGMPAGSGYVFIGEVPIGTTSFIDSNNGLGLKRGVNYCYALVAEFPSLGRGRSIPSNERCVTLLLDRPVITHVDIVSTAAVNGKVRVIWSTPKELDSLAYGPPYRYTVERATGNSGGTFSQVFISNSLTDTVFTDSLANTLVNPYRYRIRFAYGNQLTFLEQTETASSVRLSAIPSTNEINLSWSANVPWSNFVKRHYIFRNIAGTFTLIDSVLVNDSSGMRYTDRGVFGGIPIEQGREYCYQIIAQGSYFNPRLPNPLVNRSQVLCVIAKDTIPPCRNQIDVKLYDCEVIDQGQLLKAQISWSKNQDPACDTSIAFYQIYFAENLSSNFSKIAQVTDTVFIKTDLNNVSGCYKVSSVDVSGNESPLSNAVCLESCPYYELPNFLTPNADGKNDLFVPLPTPRFVKSVKFKVFNRWGVEVFEIGNDIYLNWNGKDKNGKALPGGVYFYTADVTFFTVSDQSRTKFLKGWIQVFGQDERKEP
jgi:gliding motility-associated-like protein